MDDFRISGKMKVKTVKDSFKDSFGLTLRIYDGRSFADDDATVASIRKEKVQGADIVVKRNVKVGNLETRIMKEFGIKVQIAGSDDSYLCNNDLTLKGALEEDVKKLERRAKKQVGKSDDNDWTEISFDDQGEDSEDQQETMEVIITDVVGDEFIYWIDLTEMPEDEDEYDWSIDLARAYHLEHVGSEIDDEFASEPFTREPSEYILVNKKN